MMKRRRTDKFYLCVLNTVTCRYQPRREDLLKPLDSVESADREPRYTYAEALEKAREANAALAFGRRH